MLYAVNINLYPYSSAVARCVFEEVGRVRSVFIANVVWPTREWFAPAICIHQAWIASLHRLHSLTNCAVCAMRPKVRWFEVLTPAYAPGIEAWSDGGLACWWRFDTLLQARPRRPQLGWSCRRSQSVFRRCCLHAGHRPSGSLPMPAFGPASLQKMALHRASQFLPNWPKGQRSSSLPVRNNLGLESTSCTKVEPAAFLADHSSCVMTLGLISRFNCACTGCNA